MLLILFYSSISLNNIPKLYLLDNIPKYCHIGVVVASILV